jgi:sulfate transport system substrate-binding protein
MRSYRFRLVFAVLAILLSFSAAVAALRSMSASYSSDASHKMFDDFNKAFIKHWKTRTGVEVTIRHAESKPGIPLRANVDGLDVMSLALSYDPETLQKASKFSLPDWQKPLPQKSPYTSTIVFLVRNGNPKKVRDWNDLANPGIEIVTSNPKTSGDARWSYLAAWGYALKQHGGSDVAAIEFIKKIFGNVKTLETGTRSSVTTFVERGRGDVLLTWENEAHLIVKEHGGDKFEIVTPSLSILAEPAVSIVSDVASRNGTREVTRAYIDYLYTLKAQEIAARHYYRPRDERIAARYSMQFPFLELFTVDDVFGGWKEALNIHFADDGIFDRIQTHSRALH